MSEIMEFTPTVKKALSKKSKEYKTINEISGITGLSSNLVVDILTDLERKGSVERATKTTKYGIKINAYRLKKKTAFWKEKLTTL